MLKMAPWVCLVALLTINHQIKADTVTTKDLESILFGITGMMGEVDVMLGVVDDALEDIKEEAEKEKPLCDQVLPSWHAGVASDVAAVKLKVEKAGTCEVFEDQLSVFTKERSELISQVSDLSAKIESFSAASTVQVVADSGPPRDCTALQKLGGITGESTIHPPGLAPKVVRCDQDTHGGGWSVLLLRQRQDPQLNFRRDYREYEEGFGEVDGEHWIGLTTMQRLTNIDDYELMVTMARGDDHAVSFYRNFKVDEGSYARLRVSGYDAVNSTGGDALDYHDGMAFSTQDRDRDGGSGFNCATVSGHGGNWYNRCHRANPTGLYGGDRSVMSKSDHFLEWRHWQGSHFYLTDFAMMIRPRGSH